MSWLIGHNVDEDTHLTPEEKEEKRYIIKAEEALKRRKENRDKFYQLIEEAEKAEVESNGISDYEYNIRLWKFCGDIPKKKIWYRSSAPEIDDLVKIKFWCWEEDHDIDEDWYTQGPEDFNKTRLLLNPRVSEREYGRVFFGTATKYIPKDQVVPSSLKQEIKGYYQVGKEKVYEPFQRKQRSDLFYPPKTGISTYGSKSFQYVHITKHPSPDPSHPNGQLSVGGALFNELRKNHFDFEFWTKTYREVQTSEEQHRSFLQRHDAQSYQYHNRGLGKAINRLVLRKIKYSNLVRRVQRKWRSDWRHTSRSARLATRCQRAWRTHVLRSFGTKRTIVGLLGTNIEVEYKPPSPSTNNLLVCVYVALFLIYINEYF